METLAGTIDAHVLIQSGVLTVLCVVIPLVQTVFIILNKMRHPKIPKRDPKTGTVHGLAYLKQNYDLLVQATLPHKDTHKHYSNIYEWIQIEEMNTNNFSPEDRINLKKQMEKATPTETTPLLDSDSDATGTVHTNETSPLLDVDGDATNTVQKVNMETLGWIQEALKNPDRTKDGDDFVVQTPMMKIINHHVEMMKLTARLEQLNIGMTISKETELRVSRLAWRGAVDHLRAVTDVPELPKAVTYSAVRKMQDDKSWDKDKMGNNITPLNLIIKPWPSIQTQANGYLDSFMIDVWMYWLQIWYSLVVLNFILS
jgi:hypothetical protein